MSQLRETLKPSSGSYPSITKTNHYTAYPAIDVSRPELSAAGKVVVVTGGGRGLGKAFATYFAVAGAKAIAIIGRTQSTLDDTKKIIEDEAKRRGSPSANVLTLVADLTNNNAVKSAFSQISSRLGLVNVFVSNSGILGPLGTVKDVDVDEWWSAYELNVRGSFHALQAFLNHAADNATLINISTGAIHVGTGSNMSAYAGSKWAMVKPIDAAAAENPRLRVFHVQPGVVATDLGSHVKGINISFRDDISLPASFVVWLASPESEFLRGRFVWANWDVDELKSMEDEIIKKDLLKIKLDGWTRYPDVLKFA